MELKKLVWAFGAFGTAIAFIVIVSRRDAKL